MIILADIAALITVGLVLMFAWERLARGAILLVLRWVSPAWVPGIDFAEAFGPVVYSVLRKLERKGKIKRRTEPGGPERGGSERAFYQSGEA